MNEQRDVSFRVRLNIHVRKLAARAQTPTGIAAAGLPIAVLVLVGLVADQVALFQFDIHRWDMMAISGYSTVVVSLWLVQDFESRFVATVVRFPSGGAGRWRRG